MVPHEPLVNNDFALASAYPEFRLRQEPLRVRWSMIPSGDQRADLALGRIRTRT